MDENVSLTLPQELRANDVTHNLPVMNNESMSYTNDKPITLLPKSEPPKHGCLKMDLYLYLDHVINTTTIS